MIFRNIGKPDFCSLENILHKYTYITPVELNKIDRPRAAYGACVNHTSSPMLAADASQITPCAIMECVRGVATAATAAKPPEKRMPHREHNTHIRVLHKAFKYF